MAFNAYSVQTPEDLRAISRQHGDIQVLSQLSKRELASPASKWTSRHLVVYRLLSYPEDALLSTLRTDHDQRCPVCNDDQLLPQKLNPSRKALIEENPFEIWMKSDCELMQLQGGFFWVALSRAAFPELSEQTRTYPQRERKPVERQGYTNSMVEIDGSSPILLSSSEFEADMNDVDEDEHEERRGKPEEVTVHLVTCFLQYALNVFLLQPSATLEGGVEVRPRVERRGSKAHIAGDIIVTAEDDGGICHMRRRRLGWEMHHPCIALVEAKRAFKKGYFSEKTGSYIPVTSNENLAQYLGEAVITWKGNPELFQDEYSPLF